MFSLYHGLQCVVADKRMHVEACNKFCDIARRTCLFGTFVWDVCVHVWDVRINTKTYVFNSVTFCLP